MKNYTEEGFSMSDDHVFVTPVKMVKNVDDMQQWDKSQAYFVIIEPIQHNWKEPAILQMHTEYLGFIYAINDSIKGKNNSEASTNASEEINKLVTLLETLSKWIDETPPIQQPQRFGNQAFRTWYERLKHGAIFLLQAVLPENFHRSIPEIMVYLIEGFGNATRIDYGTGHELSFVMFLCCLFKIGYLKKIDQPATAGKVFVRYLELVRKLQIIYRMEPAGSHGVWSLDDYQFVPFIWGSMQFFGNAKFEPTCFLKNEVVNAYSHDYMFLSCIQYINQVKTGPFAEHSNQLWSISGVSTWSKINGGLIKMYKAEVLSKFPLVQHIYFGSLFTLNQADHGSSIRRPRLSSTAPPPILDPFKVPSQCSSNSSQDQNEESDI